MVGFFDSWIYCPKGTYWESVIHLTKAHVEIYISECSQRIIHNHICLETSYGFTLFDSRILDNRLTLDNMEDLVGVVDLVHGLLCCGYERTVTWHGASLTYALCNFRGQLDMDRAKLRLQLQDRNPETLFHEGGYTRYKDGEPTRDHIATKRHHICYVPGPHVSNHVAVNKVPKTRPASKVRSYKNLLLQAVGQANTVDEKGSSRRSGVV